jgi:endonuclease/exonuclease/phosphatase family metal-dependent hydrolase
VVTAVRLASFNVLSGRSLHASQADPRLLADSVTRLGADVVALQEVDRHQDRSGKCDQSDLVARAMQVEPGHGDYRFVATVHGTPGTPGWAPAIGSGPINDVPSPLHGVPSYGIALISRLPVSQWRVFGLGSTPGRYPLLVPGSRPQVMWLKDEPRAAVAAVLAEPRITIACTHLSFVPGRNAFQLRRLARWLATLPGPRVLLGDLNLPGGLPARLTGWASLLSVATYPSPAPRLQLDHLLAHGLPGGAEVTGARAVPLPVSDHCAVVADLRLPHDREQ